MSMFYTLMTRNLKIKPSLSADFGRFDGNYPIPSEYLSKKKRKRKCKSKPPLELQQHGDSSCCCAGAPPPLWAPPPRRLAMPPVLSPQYSQARHVYQSAHMAIACEVRRFKGTQLPTLPPPLSSSVCVFGVLALLLINNWLDLNADCVVRCTIYVTCKTERVTESSYAFRWIFSLLSAALTAHHNILFSFPQ